MVSQVWPSRLCSRVISGRRVVMTAKRPYPEVRCHGAREFSHGVTEERVESPRVDRRTGIARDSWRSAAVEGRCRHGTGIQGRGMVLWERKEG